MQLEVAWRDPPSDVIPPGTRVDFADFPGLIEEMRAFRSMFVPNAQLKTRAKRCGTPSGWACTPRFAFRS